jgi:hypothetical protein
MPRNTRACVLLGGSFLLDFRQQKPLGAEEAVERVELNSRKPEVLEGTRMSWRE